MTTQKWQHKNDNTKNNNAQKKKAQIYLEFVRDSSSTPNIPSLDQQQQQQSIDVCDKTNVQRDEHNTAIAYQ